MFGLVPIYISKQEIQKICIVDICYTGPPTTAVPLLLIKTFPLVGIPCYVVFVRTIKLLLLMETAHDPGLARELVTWDWFLQSVIQGEGDLSPKGLSH